MALRSWVGRTIIELCGQLNWARNGLLAYKILAYISCRDSIYQWPIIKNSRRTLFRWICRNCCHQAWTILTPETINYQIGLLPNNCDFFNRPKSKVGGLEPFGKSGGILNCCFQYWQEHIFGQFSIFWAISISSDF